MTLKLNLNGSAEPFINYLKNYLRIRESLLLEIDTDLRAFVAKTFTEDHASIRFASLTFDDAHITVVDDSDSASRNGQRIKVGVLIKLKKLIQIVERFGSDANEKGECNFDIVVEYGPMERKDEKTNQNYTDFVATEISFRSSILKMKMDGFRITEFAYLSDEAFINNVFTVNDPVTVPVTAASIASIVKTSDIIKIDPRKDALVFYNDNNMLYVKDQAEGLGKQPNFVYLIGQLDHAVEEQFSVPISRERFIKMLDKCDENFNIIIGLYGGIMDRILFDSTTNSTKIVVSAMRNC